MDGELRKKLWSLAWPAILANIGQTLVNLVDMIMVGQLGSLAIASVGLGGQFFLVYDATHVCNLYWNPCTGCQICWG